MKKEDLIKQLEAMPAGIEVMVCDWRKNYGDGDGTTGIKGFELELMGIDAEEAEHQLEVSGEEFTPWVALYFDNDDYDDEGNSLQGVTDEPENKVVEKAKKWDALGEKIAKFYPENEEETTGDLTDIGLEAAHALGYM